MSTTYATSTLAYAADHLVCSKVVVRKERRGREDPSLCQASRQTQIFLRVFVWRSGSR